MLLTLKIILIISFILVIYQDINERLVYWILFPIVGICSGVLMYNELTNEIFFATFIFNICLVTIILLAIYLYTKIIKKMNFLDAIGLGDILLFYALSFTFGIVSFYILFISALVFAITLQLLIRNKLKKKTVPLAGYISLFFGLVFISYWTGIIESVYYI